MIGQPVFLTENVHGRYVIPDIEEYREYEKMPAMKKFISEPEKVRLSGDTEGYHPAEKVFRELEERYHAYARDFSAGNIDLTDIGDYIANDLHNTHPARSLIGRIKKSDFALEDFTETGTPIEAEKSTAPHSYVICRNYIVFNYLDDERVFAAKFCILQ